jgi:hypothetical protein
LVVAIATECDGVIDVTEGKSEKAASLASFRDAIGGKVYTVLKRAQIQEVGDGTIAAGDKLFASAAGAMHVGPGGGAGAVFLGVVLPDDTVRGGAGLYLDLDINGAPVGTA